MAMSLPTKTLSVIIPTYNYATYLPRAVKSVIEQSQSVHEIIIVDDGSTDDTKEVVKSLCAEFSHVPICYIYQQNSGVSAARNRGFAESTGDYLWFLDADDCLLANAVERMQKSMILHPEAGMIFGGYHAINQSGKCSTRVPTELGDEQLANAALLLTDQLVGLRASSTVIQRRVLDKFQFPIDVHVDEDTMFFSRVLFHFPCVSVSDIVVEMPRHEDSLRENYERILETGVNGVEALFCSLPNTAAMVSIKRDVLLSRFLKIGRMACRREDYRIAWEHYCRAFKMSRASVMSMKHLPRMMKSAFYAALWGDRGQKVVIEAG